MTITDSLRPSIKDDIPDLKSILDSIDLFPSEMLEEMMAPYLEDPQSGELWYTAFQNGRAVGLAYCAPEKLTQRTYNHYVIRIHAIANKAKKAIAVFLNRFCYVFVSTQLKWLACPL